MPALSLPSAGSVHPDAGFTRFSLPEAVSLLRGLDIILEDS